MNELKNTVVVAGAGTGKTHRLVQEYLQTMGIDSSQPIRPHRILAMTFTDKAAAEMRTRVVSRLIDPSYKRLRRDMANAPIQTFHAFCAQLLRDHAVAAQIEPGFALLSPVEERDILTQAAESTIIDALGEVPHVDALVARFQLRRFGGGNGLVDDLISLYQKHQESGSSVIISPFASPLGDLKGGRGISPIESALSAITHAPLTPKGRTKLDHAHQSFKYLTHELNSTDDEVRLSAAYSSLRTAVGGQFGPTDLRKELVASILKLGAQLCDEKTQIEAAAIVELLKRFSDRVDAHKIIISGYGFGDLLIKARHLLATNLDVRKKIKNRFVRVLVDEFQDTSPIQEDVVALLAEDPSDESPVTLESCVLDQIRLGQGRLFVVGDPKQSIYGFRGADVSLFQHTQKTVVAQGGECESLNECRRSQGDIVDLVNRVAQATMGADFASGDRLSAIRDGVGKAGAIWRVDAGEMDNEIAQAKAVSQKVGDLLGTGLKPSDIAIFVRRIRPALPIVRALIDRGIPARVHGGEGFFARPEVMDLVAALKLVADPADELATITVLRSGFADLSDHDIVALLDNIPGWQKGLNWSQVRVASSGEQVKRFGDVMAYLNQAKNELSLPQMIDCLLDDAGYVRAMAAKPDAKQRLANANKLKMVALQLTGDNDSKISRLWAMLDDPPKEAIAETMTEFDGAVLVMTIHQSKGLEFPVVILADMQSSEPNHADNVLFDRDLGIAVSHRGRPIAACAPDTADEKQIAPVAIDRIRQAQKSRSERELSRLLYVALTRARDQVFFIDLWKDEKPIDRGLSLRRLFFAGSDADSARFYALMPIENFQFTEETIASEPVLVKDNAILAPLAPRIGPRRIFASSLGHKEQEAPAIPSPRIIDGTIAHKLLARVGEFLTNQPSSRSVFLLLQTALQLEGIKMEAHAEEALLTACLSTLCGPIEQLAKTGATLLFEHPLSVKGPGFLVEGRADLVGVLGGEAWVVDFKSTQGAFRRESTQLQLFAYAEALKQQGFSRVYLAPCLIGDASALLWQEYGLNELARWHRAVHDVTIRECSDLSPSYA